jgi:hypothetical protein
MIALKDIKKDEELTISYIDKSLHYTDRYFSVRIIILSQYLIGRQAKLQEMYLFECKCDRCRYRW